MKANTTLLITDNLNTDNIYMAHTTQRHPLQPCNVEWQQWMNGKEETRERDRDTNMKE